MRKRRHRSIRFKIKIEQIIYLVVLIFIIFIIVVQLLMEMLRSVILFFKNLDIIEWIYVFIACIGLLLLYWMAKSHEKKVAEKSKIKQQIMYQEQKRKELEKIKQQNTLNQIKQMDYREFERFVKQLFEWMGYQAKLTPIAMDGGKDIILNKNGEKAIVECKRYNKPKVTRPDVQKFHSALIDCRAVKGYYVTTGEFTKPAKDYCIDKPIDLINGEELVKMLQNLLNQQEKLLNDTTLDIERRSNKIFGK